MVASRVKTYILATGVFLAVACQDPVNNASDVKIVNGVVIGNINDQVARSTIKLILNGGTGTCTGTLIGPNHIVTAGHCVHQSKVRSLTLGYGVSGQAIPGVTVVNYAAHPQFEAPGVSLGRNDIGIVAFRGTLPATLRPVAIGSLQDIRVGQQFRLAGYGATGDDKMGTGTLRAVGPVSLANVNPNLNQFSQRTGDVGGSCFGDSGGPSYITDSNNDFCVIGAVSYGQACDMRDGTNTAVPAYTNWIIETFAGMQQPFTPITCRTGGNIAQVSPEEGTRNEADRLVPPGANANSAAKSSLVTGNTQSSGVNRDLDAGAAQSSTTLSSALSQVNFHMQLAAKVSQGSYILRFLAANLDKISGDEKLEWCNGSTETCTTQAGSWNAAQNLKPVANNSISAETDGPVTLKIGQKITVRLTEGSDTPIIYGFEIVEKAK